MQSALSGPTDWILRYIQKFLYLFYIGLELMEWEGEGWGGVEAAEESLPNL